MPEHVANRPKKCGDIDIIIKRDGTWWHEGTPIKRTKMVALFASVLQKKGDAYWLVTPVEEMRIQVEDAPFVITDVQYAPTETREYQVQDTIGRTHHITQPPFLKKNVDGIEIFHVMLERGLLGQFNRQTHIELSQYISIENNGSWQLKMPQDENFIWAEGVIDE